MAYGNQYVEEFGDDEYAIRSFLRRRDRWRKSNPQCESHVVAFLTTYKPAARVMWKCGKCGNEIRNGDRLRDAAGHVRKHCGCRSGALAGWGTTRQSSGGLWSTPQGKRLARIMAKPGFKPVKHDAHVRERRQQLAHQRRVAHEERLKSPRRTAAEKLQQKLANQSRWTAELSDSYVAKRLKKNEPLLKGMKLPQALIDLERMRLKIVREINRKG
jgi:hypothetical protein